MNRRSFERHLKRVAVKPRRIYRVRRADEVIEVEGGGLHNIVILPREDVSLREFYEPS